MARPVTGGLSRDAADLVVIGAGPAGLAAAIRGAAAGLSTLVVESATVGGQAVLSPHLNDYPGFPEGIAGRELVQRLYQQALSLNVEFRAERAIALQRLDEDCRVQLADAAELRSRTVVLAGGAALRRTGIQGVDRLAGAGVHYNALADDPAAMTGEDVVVTGTDQAAGQASLGLARYATNVTLVLRGGLEATHSAELVSAIERTRNIRVRVNTQVVDAFGESRLEGVMVRHRVSGTTEAVRARALFALFGAQPGSALVKDVIKLDELGYVLTGADLEKGRGAAGDWPLDREPLMLETSLPGVLAAGDVRHGSSKRVTAAMLEGSVAAMQAQRYLQELQSVPVSATT